VPKILNPGRKLEEQGCEALFLSCAADPGLDALRAAVAIPVAPAGSAAGMFAVEWLGASLDAKTAPEEAVCG